jgi:hypothetical protein
MQIKTSRTIENQKTCAKKTNALIDVESQKGPALKKSKLHESSAKNSLRTLFLFRKKKVCMGIASKKILNV